MALADLSAPIPPELREVEDLLRRFGVWAAGRGTQGVTAGPDVHECRRVMYQLAAPWRAALELLYVPAREPIEARMRRLRLTPRMLRERQIAALYALRNLMRVR